MSSKEAQPCAPSSLRIEFRSLTALVLCLAVVMLVAAHVGYSLGRSSTPQQRPSTPFSLQDNDAFQAQQSPTQCHSRREDVVALRPFQVLTTLRAKTSTRYHSMAEAYEALVHPALTTHESPSTVGIVVGEEPCAVVREVLKHTRVQTIHVFVLDILGDSCDLCHDLRGVHPQCLKDDRVKVWELGDNNNDEALLEMKNTLMKQDVLFDVVIAGVGKASSSMPSVSSNKPLFNMLAPFVQETGIMVNRLDKSERLHRPEWLDFFADDMGMKSVLHYSVGAVAKYSTGTDFIISFKSWNTRTRWFQNEAQVQLYLKKNLHQTTASTVESTLKFFDGATMATFQQPSRQIENEGCDDEAEDDDCGPGYLAERDMVKGEYLEVRRSIVANGGRGVFTTRDIPAGSMVGLDLCVNGVLAYPLSRKLIRESRVALGEYSNYWNTLDYGYFEGYGWSGSVYGGAAVAVDTSLLSFVNHGCSMTHNVGKPVDEQFSAETMRGTSPPEGLIEFDGLDPFDERSQSVLGCGEFVALRAINANEELFANYITYGGDDPEEFKANLREIQLVCSGGVGHVNSYEETSSPWVVTAQD